MTRLPMKPISAFLAVSLLGSMFVSAAPREWTEQATGRKINAEFVAVEGDQVKLSINGREVLVPVARLSEADQAYLKIVGDPGTPAPAEAPGGVVEEKKANSPANKVQGPVEAEGSNYHYYIPTTLAPGAKAPILMYSGALGADANTVKGMIEGAEICGWVAACSVESSNRADPELNQTNIAKSMKHLIANQPVDPARLYFSGHSGGARMAFRANKRLKGAGVLAYIAGAQDDEISRSHRYFIVSGSTDYNRYDTATTFAAAKKISAYRLHPEGHTNGPGWLMTEGMVWLQMMANVDAGTMTPERAAFEGRAIEWIEKTKGSAPHRAAWWARSFKTVGVSPVHSAKISALDAELSAGPENAAYIKGIADIEEFADSVLAKISIYSEKGHTTPEIQKKCDKLLVEHSGTPWISDVLTALKNKTGN